MVGISSVENSCLLVGILLGSAADRDLAKVRHKRPTMVWIWIEPELNLQENSILVPEQKQIEHQIWRISRVLRMNVQLWMRWHIYCTNLLLMWGRKNIAGSAYIIYIKPPFILARWKQYVWRDPRYRFGDFFETDSETFLWKSLEKPRRYTAL